MNIKIIQMADKPHGDKYVHCLNINRQYCKKHGYKFHEQQPAWPTPGVGYGSSGEAYYMPYQKPYVLLENLHKYDYIVWVDVDAIFVNHEKKIEDVINLAPEKDMIYFDDIGSPLPRSLNSGVLIFKNTTIAAHILWQWWEACRSINTQSRRLFNWDQGLLIELLERGTFVEGHKLDPLPRTLMNQHPKNFKSGELLIHWMGYWPESIREHMKFLCNKMDNAEFVGRYLEVFGPMNEKGANGAPCKTIPVENVIEKLKNIN
jgi:hypothetical protein